jgi:outer membrane protein TolC
MTRGASLRAIERRFRITLAFSAAVLLLSSPLFGSKDPGDERRGGARRSGTLAGNERAKPAQTESAPDGGTASGGGASPTGDGSSSGSSAAETGAGPSSAATVFLGSEISLTVRDAVLLALEHNGSLAVERIGNAITKTYEMEEKGVFDPVLSGDLAYLNTRGPVTSENAAASAGISVPLPSGTDVVGEVTMETGDRSFLGYSAGVSQELLQGAGRKANLARVRQAEIDSFSSDYELKGFTEALVASVENAYWDRLSAERRVEIYIEGLRLAEQQLDEIRQRVDVGATPAIELIAARAEVALRKDSLFEAESLLDKSRLQFLSLLNIPSDELYNIRVVTFEQPVKPDADRESLDEHVASALGERTELKQADLERQKGELEVVKTRNGLLPRLELFISLGRSEYSDSFSGSYAGTDGDLTIDATLAFSYPIGNRQARARKDRAVLTVRQAETAIENLRRLIELDVRFAYTDVTRTRSQIDTTAVSRSLQEEKLAAETEKFRVGRSTALLVAQSQRDLLDSKIAEEEALIGHLKSLVNLYWLDGSLLRRRGIEAPADAGND